jgi:D-sedoheptulose 7-phosphate isomerase
MNNRISQAITSSIDTKQAILASPALLQRVEAAAALMGDALRGGGKVHFCGNGGSAADAQHLAAELSGRFYYDRPPLNAEALHCNSSYLTAVANDYGYDEVYARLLRGTARPGDVLVAISTSGNSTNILNACRAAREMDMRIVGLTGATGGKMAEYCDVLLNVPSTDTPRIQESHIMLGHILCELVEAELFPKQE